MNNKFEWSRYWLIFLLAVMAILMGILKMVYKPEIRVPEKEINLTPTPVERIEEIDITSSPTNNEGNEENNSEDSDGDMFGIEP